MQCAPRNSEQWYFIKKLAGAIVIASVLAGFLILLATTVSTTVNAAPEATPPLDCLSCHPRTLEVSHNKLGSGNKACQVCHDSTDMKKLRLVDDTLIPLSDSPQLCAQCHQTRYSAWKEGIHGISGTVAAVACASCHNPHQPQIIFTNITEPHPAPTPSPPAPPFKPWLMLGFLLLFPLITLAIVESRRG